MKQIMEFGRNLWATLRGLVAPADERLAPDGQFRLSRWTIRWKLQLIISGIILLSLSAMIWLASIFFLNDNKIRVREIQLDLVSLVSENVHTGVDSIARTVRMAAGVMTRSPQSRAVLEKQLFGADESLIYIGIYERDGAGLRAKQRLINDAYLENNQIAASEFANLSTRYVQSFARSFDGTTVLVNASPGFRTPIVGISLPNPGTGTILISYLKMDFFLESFQTSGTSSVYMVDDRGSIVAHPDAQIVLSGASFADEAIVKIMQKSSLDNGQRRYYRNQDESWHIGSFRKLPQLGLGIVASVSEDKAFAAVYDIRRWNILLMIAVVSLAILIVFYFARGLTRPILKLVTAARMIRDGDYDVKLRPETHDEVGLLADSFNSMSRGLQERENLKVSFGKFVNKELAEMSLSGELSLGGERKEVAVFFSDIRGFTSISEKLRPEEVVEFLNEYFTRMVHCVNETHGSVDKFIGDALMAVWGALRSHGNNTDNAVTAALRMREELLDFNRGRGGARRPIIHMGAGINTGPVIAGQIGSDQKMEYTVIGDTVNLASRTESLCKQFGVDLIITQFALDRLPKGVYRTVLLDDIKVKGKTKPVTVYAVLGRNGDRNCPGSVEELREMVGIQFDPKAAR